MAKCTHKWLDLYTLFELIHKHNWNEISLDWYNGLVFMETRCEIKTIETQSDGMINWPDKLAW